MTSLGFRESNRNLDDCTDKQSQSGRKILVLSSPTAPSGSLQSWKKLNFYKRLFSNYVIHSSVLPLGSAGALALRYKGVTEGRERV